MGGRAGGGARGRNGAKGKITWSGRGSGTYDKYQIEYTINGQKGPHTATFMTKKGADLFTTAIKNGNGARWSYDVAKKVDMKTKQTLVQGQVKAAARRKLGKMIASGELKSQYPNGIPIGKSITVTL